MTRADRFRLTLAGIGTAAMLALSAPAAASDPRLVTLVYDEAAVVTIVGAVKVQTTIQFAPDEIIENVAIGDSAAWQVAPNKAQSHLFVKPLAVNAKTNMTVVTDKRTYLFDLVANGRSTPVYVLRFRYPELERQMEEERLAAERAAEEERLEANSVELTAADDPYAVQDPERLNFAWVAKGDAKLLPARTYDNGEAVFLTWPEGTPIPAILVTNEDGDEGPVNFTVRGDTVVLDSVPATIILRSGEDFATLTNNGPVLSAGPDTNGRRGS
jgi:type IV secretion system protein VirB9